MKGALSVTIAAFVAALAMDAQAGFKEGMAALDRDDYETAFRELKPVAEKGDALAQHQIGVMYFMGKGAKQDYGEAAKWYRKAADQGLDAAELNLGIMYLRGYGVPTDYAEAMKLLRRAPPWRNVQRRARSIRRSRKSSGMVSKGGGKG
jgi:TPR repeat protein